MNRTLLASLLWPLLLAAPCFSQAPGNQAPGGPVSYTSIAELDQILANLQQGSLAAQQDLSRLRIDRWKADSGTKRETSSNVESIRRNLQTALPGMLADLKNSPENTVLTFKVYRNLDALYDVVTSVVESAGAFGTLSLIHI